MIAMRWCSRLIGDKQCLLAKIGARVIGLGDGFPSSCGDWKFKWPLPEQRIVCEALMEYCMVDKQRYLFMQSSHTLLRKFDGDPSLVMHVHCTDRDSSFIPKTSNSTANLLMMKLDGAESPEWVLEPLRARI